MFKIWFLPILRTLVSILQSISSVIRNLHVNGLRLRLSSRQIRSWQGRLVAEAATQRGIFRRHPRWAEVAVLLFRLAYRATQHSRLKRAASSSPPPPPPPLSVIVTVDRIVNSSRISNTTVHRGYPGYQTLSRGWAVSG